MSEKNIDTEFALWAKTTPGQRSFLVEVLHWFHYRTPALKQSWGREEVLTWELLRALELLPQSIFIRPLLVQLSTLTPERNEVIAPLLSAERLTVTYYPSLKLSGSKRNCRSDIGIGLLESPTIWIEAKTARFKSEDLRCQLDQQKRALKRIFPDTPTLLATLLPDSKAQADVPNISWDSVCNILDSGIGKLCECGLEDDITHGYTLIARELIDRIQSHPNRRAGWV